MFQALFILVHHHANRLDLPAALELAEQLVDVAENAEEPLPAIMAHWARGFVFCCSGRIAEACDVHDKVVELYAPQQHASLAYIFGLDPAVSALAFNATGYWYLGYPERGLALAQRGIALAERVNHPSSLAHVLLHAAELAMFLRETEALAEYSGMLVRVCEEKGVALFGAWGHFLQGWVLVEQGQVAKGLERLCEGWETIKATGSRLGHAEAVHFLSQAHGRSGKTAEGLALGDEALALVSAGDSPRFEAEMHRVRGELLLQQGKAPGEVEACLRRAIEIARARDAKVFELRAATSLCRLLRTAGRREEARGMLAGVLGWFTEGFETSDLKEARRLLDDLS